MKIAHLLVQYLHQSKKMQLKGIGEFTLDNFYENPFEGEKGRIKVPENAIRFSPNKKVGEDEGLIDFISQHTKKIKPLAASDLEDYLSIGKQLLNVSKQFYIEGLGTLLLNSQGGFEFVQGNEIFSPVVMEENTINKSKLEENPNEINFEKSYHKPSGVNIKKLLVILAFAAGVFIVGWIGWHFFQQWQNNKSETPKEVVENIQPVLTEPKADSALSELKKDSVVVSSAPVDSATNNTYNIVIETAKRQRAEYRYNDLKKMGYNVSIRTEDSVTFKIYTTIAGPLSDTAKTIDSLSRFFGRKVFLDVKQ